MKTDAVTPRISWRPKLLDPLAGYSRSDYTADVQAVLTVGIVALPLAMAFGITSGVTPQAGIYTAIVAGFLVAIPVTGRHRSHGDQFPIRSPLADSGPDSCFDATLRRACRRSTGPRHPGRSVWLIACVLTAVAGITVAAEARIAFAAFFYFHRVSATTTVPT